MISKVNELLQASLIMNHDRRQGEHQLTSKLSYAALVIIVIGAACLVFAEVKLSDVSVTQLARSDDSVLYWTFNLTRGKTYRIDILAGGKWGRDYYAALFTEAQPVNVTITFMNGGVTSLQAFFFGIPPDNPYYPEGTPLTIVDVKWQDVDDTNIRAITSAMKIMMTIKQSGLYTVRVLEQGLWSNGPPNYFALIEVFTPNSDTYSLMAFGGGITAMAGGVIYVVSVFRKRKMRSRAR
jgi:hypothetical protein